MLKEPGSRVAVQKRRIEKCWNKLIKGNNRGMENKITTGTQRL
jgi:hypothetical protein